MQQPGASGRSIEAEHEQVRPALEPVHKRTRVQIVDRAQSDGLHVNSKLKLQTPKGVQSDSLEFGVGSWELTREQTISFKRLQ